jgi:hypothetical protein
MNVVEDLIVQLEATTEQLATLLRSQNQDWRPADGPWSFRDIASHGGISDGMCPGVGALDGVSGQAALRTTTTKAGTSVIGTWRNRSAYGVRPATGYSRSFDPYRPSDCREREVI